MVEATKFLGQNTISKDYIQKGLNMMSKRLGGKEADNVDSSFVYFSDTIHNHIVHPL